MITVQRNNAASGSSTPRGVQFLSPRHVPVGGTLKGTIIRVTTDKPDNFSNPYVVYFLINGTKYSKGFKPTSDALAQLVELFGSDEKKWKDKPVTIGVQADEDEGQRLTYSKG
jgi:hypothetical protein